MKSSKLYGGIFFVVAVPLIAFLLWLMSPTVDLRVSNGLELAFLLGKVFGIVGMMLFAESLILSARFKFLDNIFRGLHMVYLRHGQIGQIGFMFMLFHPLLLLFQYTDLSFGRMVSFLTPSPYTLANNFGQIALYLLILLIALTLYLKPKYNIWKWTHKFMGLAFFFAGLHVFMVPSDTSAFLPLRAYVLFVSAAALYSYIYHTVLNRYTTRRYKYQVTNVRDLGAGITEVVLKPTGDKLQFQPGQFAFISFRDKNVGYESHPFSMSSDNESDQVSFTIKNLGDWTSRVKSLPVGTNALVEGPFGKFSVAEADFKKQIWIAGGIGITPFLSMARSLRAEDGYQVDLYYCVRNAAEAVYLQELESMQNSAINIIPHYSDSSGFIDAMKISNRSGVLDKQSIFICSPVPMIRALRKGFNALGVGQQFIHSEEFSL